MLGPCLLMKYQIPEKLLFVLGLKLIFLDLSQVLVLLKYQWYQKDSEVMSNIYHLAGMIYPHKQLMDGPM